MNPELKPLDLVYRISKLNSMVTFFLKEGSKIPTHNINGYEVNSVILLANKLARMADELQKKGTPKRTKEDEAQLRKDLLYLCTGEEEIPDLKEKLPQINNLINTVVDIYYGR